MRRFSICMFIAIIISVISNAQTRDVTVWVKNDHSNIYPKVFFDALYSPEVGPIRVAPGDTQAFTVKELTLIKIVVFQKIIYEETKDINYFNQIRHDRLFIVRSDEKVDVISGNKLDLQRTNLPKNNIEPFKYLGR